VIIYTCVQIRQEEAVLVASFSSSSFALRLPLLYQRTAKWPIFRNRTTSEVGIDMANCIQLYIYIIQNFLKIGGGRDFTNNSAE